MTANELIRLLKVYAANGYGDAEVTLGTVHGPSVQDAAPSIGFPDKKVVIR